MTDDRTGGRPRPTIVGTLPFRPPLPVRQAFGAVVPEPRRVTRCGTARIRESSIKVVDEAGAPGPCRVLLEGLWRAGIRASTTEVGWPVTLRQAEVMGGDEAYRLASTTDGMVLKGSVPTGLARAAATARQLFALDASGGIDVALATIDDSPTVPRRLLAGWGLYRSEHLEDAIEIAIEGKFNRVLYNWWTAGVEEKMSDTDGVLIDRARALGIEVVVELRRQALGPAFSPGDDDAVEVLLTHYDDAARRGVRCFGFLFDDTDVDSFEEEWALLGRITARCRAAAGEAIEFYYCPRFYWLPGEFDYSWMGGALGPMLGGDEPRSFEAAVDRQTEFLDGLGKMLDDDTLVYLANWWTGTPDGWESQLLEGWTRHVGRPPVFWDNQLQNDYRAAIVAPFAAHNRQAAFARALDGYCLNAPVPIAAHAPGAVTAGAWAWNPEGYDAGAALGVAVGRLFGAAAVETLADWIALVLELLGDGAGLRTHYRALLAAANQGRAGILRDQLRAAGRRLALAAAATDATALGREGLLQIAGDARRLELELSIAELPESAELVAWLEEQVVATLAARLPGVPGLAAIARSSPGLDTTSTFPGISWALHFVTGPWAALRRTLIDPRRPT